MTAVSIHPSRLQKEGDRALKITWDDGHLSAYAFRSLRQNCQCALCVEEWSGKGLLEKEKIPQSLAGLHVAIVGQYALRIDFSDGHNTGIFTFKQLRALCPCPACALSGPN